MGGWRGDGVRQLKAVEKIMNGLKADLEAMQTRAETAEALVRSTQFELDHSKTLLDERLEAQLTGARVEHQVI